MGVGNEIPYPFARSRNPAAQMKKKIRKTKSGKKFEKIPDEFK